MHRLIISTLRVAILGLFGLAAVVAFGAATRVDAQPAPRDQSESDLVFESDRSQYLLVWVEDRGAGNHIWAKRIRDNGLPVGGADGGEWEITGNTGDPAMGNPKGDQRQPAVVEGLLVWSEMAPGATDYDIYAQRLFSNFRAYGKPTMLAGGPGNQVSPDVVANGRNNEWLVVWSEDTSDAGDVVGRRFGASLTPRSSIFEVAKGPGTAEDPTIARDLFDTDSFLVLFTDDRNGNKDIFGTRITEAGVPRGGPLAGPFEVVKTPEDDYAPQLVVNSTRGQPVVAPVIRGGGSQTRNVLLWTHDDVTDGPDVMAQRLNNNGLVSGAPFAIAAGMGVQTQPAGDLRTEGSREQWLVTWSDDANGTLDVRGVELGLNGIIRRPSRLLATD